MWKLKLLQMIFADSQVICPEKNYSFLALTDEKLL